MKAKAGSAATLERPGCGGRAALAGAKGRGARMAVLLTALLTLVSLLALTAAPALAAEAPEECPNQRLREESNLDPATERPYSTELPDCRAFEQVSPAFKNLALQSGLGIIGDGSRVLSESVGSVDGSGSSGNVGVKSLYAFLRDTAGWRTTAVTPEGFNPTSLVAGYGSPGGDVLIGLRQLGGPPLEDNLYVRRPSGELVEVGPIIAPTGVGSTIDDQRRENYSEEVQGASTDLSHVLFTILLPQREGGTSLWPGDDPVGESSLYEYVGVGGSEPVLVGVRNEGRLQGTPHVNEGAELISHCGTYLGARRRAAGAVSGDGETVFFTAWECPGGPAVDEIYARRGAAHTLAISEPPLQGACEEAECIEDATDPADLRSASFEGSSQDGREVFFTSPQRLLDSATQDPAPEDRATGVSGSERCSRTVGPNGCNLYLYRLDRSANEALTDISVGDTSGGGPQVQGVGAISEDGSHVYFVARGVLTATPNGYGAGAEPGQQNLYCASTTDGHVAFIARLSAEDSGQWISGERMQTTPDGRFLLFTSTADLTPDAEGETQQVYRYDSAEDRLIRVSIGEAGLGEDGNGASSYVPRPNLRLAHPNFDQNPALADEGAVVFASAAILTADAPSAGFKIYEYEEGHVRLVGVNQTATEPSVIQGISHSGRDIFFVSPLALVAQDRDSAQDLYDARVEGGFPAPIGQPGCSSSQACQGAGSQASPGAAPATSAFAGPEEGARHARLRPNHRRHRHHRRHRRRHRHRGPGQRQGSPSNHTERGHR